jgi:electron transfer flavoprotein-quinone oxidoreductase
MAIMAGKHAAETALEAHSRGDFSERVMSRYKDRLDEGFILKDLRQYRRFAQFLETHENFMEVYPSFVNDALGQFFSAYGKPKKQLFNGMVGALTDRRSLLKAAGDIVSMARAVMGW